MYRLLKLEYTKFRNHSLIVILLLLYAVFFPTIIFLGKEINDLPDPLPGNSIFYKFPSTWDYLGYIGSWLSFFFLGLVAVFSIVNEVTYKTFRQNIISGLTRKEYFLAKFYSITVISLGAAILYLVTGFLIGAVHTENWTLAEAFDNSWAPVRYFLMCMGYMSFGMFCGFILRRSGLAVLFYLIYGLLIDLGIKWLINFKVISHGAVRFTPMNTFEDMMPLPFYRFVDLIPDVDFDFEFLLTYWEASIATVAWTAIFLYFCYRNFTRRDL